MKKLMKTALALAFASTLTSISVLGQNGSQWAIDENGPALLTGGPIGGYSNGRYQVDPMSGLLGWYYQLAPSVPGDVLLLEPHPPGGPTNVLSDLLRFDGQGVYFFSDLELGELNPDHADVPRMPNPVGSNVVSLLEIGPEGNNGAFYFPGAGQPGFDTTGQLPGLSYHFISDVPEPSTIALLWVAEALMGLKALRRKPSASVGGHSLFAGGAAHRGGYERALDAGGAQSGRRQSSRRTSA